MLAVHAANAALSGASEASFKSNLGYSGEQWDASLRMQNLRARAYDPRNGRFIGLDPFAGNMQDPQSLHKYAYVHGDPVQGIDPTGMMSLAGSIAFSAAFSVAIGIGIKVYRGQTDQITLKSVVYDLVIGAALGGAFFGIGWGFNLLRGGGAAAEAAATNSLLSGSVAQISKLLPSYVANALEQIWVTTPTFTGTLGRRIVATFPNAAKADILTFIGQSIEVLGARGFLGKVVPHTGDLVPTLGGKPAAGRVLAESKEIWFGARAPLSTIFEEFANFRYLHSRGLWGSGFQSLSPAAKQLVEAEAELSAKVLARQFGFEVSEQTTARLAAEVERLRQFASGVL